MRKIYLSLVAIIALAVIAGFFDSYRQLSWLPDWFFKPYKLGLDLRGGAHLVYEADMKDVVEKERYVALNGVRDVIERRVNAFGISEPLVQTTKTGDHFRVIVELAGVKDISAAKKMIGETPVLEFKEQNPQPQRDLTPDEKKQMEEYNAKVKQKAQEVVKKAQGGADFDTLIKQYSDEVARGPINVEIPVESEKNTKENASAAGKEGDLGFIRKDGAYAIIVEALEKASTAKGGILSQAVETGEGWNIARLEEKRKTDEEVQARHILICFKGAEKCDKNISKEEARKKIDELKSKATPQNFETLAKENSTEPGAAERGGDLGWFKRGAMVKPFEDTVFAQAKGTISGVVETKFGFHLIYKIGERGIFEYHVRRILLKTKLPSDYAPYEPWKNTDLSGKQLSKATVQFDPSSGLPQVGLKFNAEGAKFFEEITTRNVGKPVAIFLDQQIISAPRVQEAIKGGEAVITGDFSLKEAKLLAQRLNAGALPVPVELISEKVVEASLGKDSLDKSLSAGAWGLILVALFMILYYRFPGVIAVASLVVYSVLLLAVFKLIGVTLTLAGIAGVILSLGMAVDANVLTFERLKEELRAGLPLQPSLSRAFSRSWLAVRDGHVTTIVTSFILMTFTTSLVKGFAVTLLLGTFLALFSGMVVTRVFLIATAPWVSRLWMYGVKKK